MGYAYEVALQAPGTLAAAKPVYEIYTSATGQPLITYLEFKSALGGGTGANISYGLGFPAAVGINRVSPGIGFVCDDPSQIETNIFVTYLWGTPPTIPTNFLRRFSLTNTTGPSTPGAFTLRFPRGLKLAASKSLVLWCLATPPTATPFCSMPTIVVGADL